MAHDDFTKELGAQLDVDRLHFAAQDGNLTLVRKHLAEGLSPNKFDDIAKTPLHYAAEGGHLEVMRALLEAGADVNANDPKQVGNTPLRAVAENCSLEVAKLLIESGADPKIPGWMQITALQKASARKHGDGPKVYALLQEAAAKLG